MNQPAVHFIPVIVFALWGLYGFRTLPSLRDPAIVRRPESQFWSPRRFLNGAEWTEAGRRARWRHVVHWIVGLGLGMAAHLVVALFDPGR
jgi:hypothetical protein